MAFAQLTDFVVFLKSKVNKLFQGISYSLEPLFQEH